MHWLMMLMLPGGCVDREVYPDVSVLQVDSYYFHYQVGMRHMQSTIYTA